MKVVTNTKLIKRNSKIGQYASLGGMVILVIGLYVNIAYKEKYFVYTLAALLIGFIMSQVGMYYGNRWGRSPRPDEAIDKGLKGLGREYTIFHYTTPSAHLLVGPAGIWTLLPFYQAGVITYEKKRWRSKGGGFVRSYLRVFGQESMGRPDIESEAEIQTASRYLAKILPEGQVPPSVQSLMIFTNPKAELHLVDSPIPAVTPKELKDFIRNKAKENPMNPQMLDTLHKVLPQADRED